MRILYLAHRFPYPPDKGERIRTYHHLRHLGGAHEVHLLTFADGSHDERGLRELGRLCRSVEVIRVSRAAAFGRGAAALVSGGALSAAYFGDTRARRAIAAGSFDLAWASSSSTAPLLEGVAAPRVVDLVDVDSEKWREFAEFSSPPASWIYAREARCVRRLEARIAKSAECILVVSEAEAQALRRLAPREASLRVVPNGVDGAFFAPLEMERPTASPEVLFTGALDYFPNRDAASFFLRDVLPLLRERLPAVRFTAVGHRPSAALVRLARSAGARVEGSVPDVRPYFARALLYAAPMRFGRGVKNKVLEAMAMGVPVVASPVAVEGLAVEDGVHFVSARSAEEFAARLAELATDADRRRRLATAARSYVERSCRWESAFRGLDGMLAEIASS